MEDNFPAIEILESGRAGLPHYSRIGKYLTFAIPAVRLGLGKNGNHIQIARGTNELFSAIIVMPLFINV